MNRTRLRLGSIMSMLTGFGYQGLDLPKQSQRKIKSWKCKKCGGSFHPNRSGSLCDECVAEKFA